MRHSYRLRCFLAENYKQIVSDLGESPQKEKPKLAEISENMKEKARLRYRKYRIANGAEINAHRRKLYASEPERYKNYQKIYREKYREEINARRRAYRAEHREEINARRRVHQAEHCEEINARRKAYRAEHREEINARQRAYRAEHREEINAKRRANRAAKKAAEQQGENKSNEVNKTLV